MYLRRKKIMMKILKDIPGFERRKLHCIDCDEEVNKIILAGKLISELRSKYGTSVAYFSSRGYANEVEKYQEFCPQAVGRLYACDLKDHDVMHLCDSIEEMVDKKFVRAVIIDCLEDLDIDPDYYKGGIRAKRNEIKTNLFFLAAGCDIPVLLFCPLRKSHKYENDINPFAISILQQLQEP